MHWTRTLVAGSAVALLAACAARPPATVLAEGPRMIDLYRGTATALPAPEPPPSAQAAAEEARCRWWIFAWRCSAPGGTGAAAEHAGAEASAYTRTARNELELLFPRLPNPDVYIHVLPHLATDARVPVPGYTTAVPLYERVEYALPGELDRLPMPPEGVPGARESDGERERRPGLEAAP